MGSWYLVSWKFCQSELENDTKVGFPAATEWAQSGLEAAPKKKYYEGILESGAKVGFKVDLSHQHGTKVNGRNLMSLRNVLPSASTPYGLYL